MKKIRPSALIFVVCFIASIIISIIRTSKPNITPEKTTFISNDKIENHTKKDRSVINKKKITGSWLCVHFDKKSGIACQIHFLLNDNGTGIITNFPIQLDRVINSYPINWRVDSDNIFIHYLERPLADRGEIKRWIKFIDDDILYISDKVNSEEKLKLCRLDPGIDMLTLIQSSD